MIDNAPAILGNRGAFGSFSYAGQTIRFRASRHLEHYTKGKRRDNGYLEVMAKYDSAPDEEEEYIDLVPILNNLYIKPHILALLQI